jgi:nitroimidazol reductase NimA-like FMN-containing flavoprotein (pyridoxamine 5'-phosphate oxidase superfamily)
VEAGAQCGLLVPEETILRDLSLAECEDILRTERVGRIAVRDADGVYIVPLHYAFADGAIYGHAAPGKKLRLMRLWPHVALQVDRIAGPAEWKSVLVQGAFRELTDEEEQIHARQVLVRAFEGNPLLVTAGHGHRTTLADAIVFRIEPADITGCAEGC